MIQPKYRVQFSDDVNFKTYTTLRHAIEVAREGASNHGGAVVGRKLPGSATWDDYEILYAWSKSASGRVCKMATS